MDDLIAGIMAAFPGGRFGPKNLPVVLLPVDVTLDYISYYTPHIDPAIANFSYSEHQAGYHVFSAQRDAAGATTCAFKKYQQDAFATIAISPDDLLLVPAEQRTGAPNPWHPHELVIKNP